MDDDEVSVLVDQIKTNFGEAQYEDIVSQYMEEEKRLLMIAVFMMIALMQH